MSFCLRKKLVIIPSSHEIDDFTGIETLSIGPRNKFIKYAISFGRFTTGVPDKQTTLQSFAV